MLMMNRSEGRGTTLTIDKRVSRIEMLRPRRCFVIVSTLNQIDSDDGQ